MAKVQDGKKNQYVATSTRYVKFHQKVYVVFFVLFFVVFYRLRSAYQISDGQIALGLAVLLYFVGADCYYRLHSRTKELEDRLEEASGNTLALANCIGMAFLGSDESELQKIQTAALYGGPVPMSDALDRVDRVCNHLRVHSPGLRKVLIFSIGMSLDSLRQKTLLSEDDLKGLEKHVPGKTFWPAPRTTYEMWSTHSAVTDFLGQTMPLYSDDLQSRNPKALWRHEFGRHLEKA